EQNILDHYPTANIKDLKANQKEALSKIISYYGDSLSYDRLADLADKQVVNKYSYTEQKYGIQLLYKIENNKLTDDDRLEIKYNLMREEEDRRNRNKKKKQVKSVNNNKKSNNIKAPKI